MRFADLSHWNGAIDFTRVKNDIDGVILKVSQGNSYCDTSFEQYYQQATAVGLKVGAYVYMVANTQKSAEEEARFALKCINGKSMPLGIWLDVEDDKIRGVSNFSDNCITELKIWADAGYNVGIYANLNWYMNYLTDRLRKYPIWIARYSPNDGNLHPEKKPDIDPYMWQYTSKGRVAGIGGDVDLNEVYTTFSHDTAPAFKVRLKCNLNKRKGAGTEYPVIETLMTDYTIVSTKKASDGGTWGELEDGGWINISPKFVQRV